DLAEDELDAAGQQAVDDDHFPSFALSSLRRMLTKLYGGQGPVYLKVSLSYLAPICLTRWSNAGSLSRATRKAAFMIILSPMGLLAREATATSRSASKTSARYFSDMDCRAASTRRPYCMRAK